MKKTINFRLEGTNTEEAKKATKNYFLSQGFKLFKDSSEMLEFKRGNTLLNMVTFNPLKWNSSIKFLFNENEVKAEFNIDTSFQTVTLKEEQLWDSFISNYKESIFRKEDFSIINKKLLIETKMNSLKYIKFAFIGGVVAGIPAGIISHFSGLHGIVGVAAGGGAISYMMYHIEKDKKKNVT